MSVRGPETARDIYNVPYPNYGFSVPPNAPGDMGGSSLYSNPGREWNPRGQGGPLMDVASYADFGQPPSSHGHVTFKSFDFIGIQYMTAPTSDKANLMIKRGMPCFALREFDKEDHSNLIYPIFMLNQLSKDQWRDFLINTSRGDSEALEFLAWMRKYGDDELCAYAKAKRTGNMIPYRNESEQKMQELASFMARAEEPGYCYLTKHGWANKVNWIGANINSTVGAGLETLDTTEVEANYVNVNQGLGKRIMMGQCFGDANQVTMGSTLWIVLRRKYCHDGKYGPFLLFPGASNRESNPRNTEYVDEKGKIVKGIVYKVGTVLEPADRSATTSVREYANNTGDYGTIDDAYASCADLPTFYVNMGFKQ